MAEPCKYYALICYSRKNSLAANFLRERMKHFKVPVEKVDKMYLPPEKYYMGPMFQDKMDLDVSEQDFSENIKKAIEDSRYLIVLCSPEAASSQWVETEIKYFLESHNNDKSLIVPIILAGTPGSGDEKECLPPQLREETFTSRNLPCMIASGGERKLDGWENGWIQAASYMLHVKPDILRGSIIEEKDKIFRFYKRCVLILSALLLIFICLTVWALSSVQKAKKTLRVQPKETGAVFIPEVEKTKSSDGQTSEKNESDAKKQIERSGKKEAEARKQAEVAKKSLDYICDVLYTASPLKTGRVDFNVLETVSRKIPEIQKMEDWQLKASVAMKLGSILYYFGYDKEAMELIDTSIALYEKNAPESLEVTEGYDNSSKIFSKQGKFDKALEYNEKSQKIKRIAAPEDYSGLAKNSLDMGNIYLYQEKYQDAMVCFIKALDLYQKVPQEKQQENIALVYNSIGHLYSRQKQYKKALESYQQSVAAFRKVYPENNLYVAMNYNYIALMYIRLKNYDKALEFFHKTLAIYKKIYSKKLYLFSCYDNIADTFMLQNNFEKSMENYRNALSVYPENHPRRANVYNKMGNLFFRQKQYEKALECFNATLNIRKKYLPKNDPGLAESYRNVASTYVYLGKYAEAGKYCEHAIEHFKLSYGENHNYTKEMKEYLKAIHSKIKK